MSRLLFLGSTVADVVIRTPTLPTPGDDLHIRQQAGLGGCAFNAFRAAQATGTAQCLLASPVGGGMWGDFVRTALNARGITSAVPPAPGDNGCCYCLVTPDGERSFLCEHGAEYRFRREWLDALPTDADGVYLCGLELEESTGPVLLDWLEAHPPRRLYFAPGPRLTRLHPTLMARAASLSPLFHLSEVEAAQFTRQDDPARAAAMIRQLTLGDVVVTLGSRGAYVLTEEGGTLLSACPALVRDTVGAGDSHIGAIMAGMAEGLPLPQAVHRANLAAAAVVSQDGGELTRAAWDNQLAAHQAWMEETP